METMQRAMNRHDISALLKVHPKDKIDQKCNVINEIHCLVCNQTCMEETAEPCSLAPRQQAHQEQLSPAISDHCREENHLMDWVNARTIDIESNKHLCWIRKAIKIQKDAHQPGNWDEEPYHTWDAVLKTSKSA